MHETEAPFAESSEERETRERSEADAMGRFPGVEFWWSNGERRAKLRGSGIEVWELVRTVRDNPGITPADLVESWPHVRVETIESALCYYGAFPVAVDQRIAKDDWWTEERVAEFNEEMAKYRV